MGEGLGDGEAPLRSAEVVGEEHAREVVPSCRTAPERSLGLVETVAMVLDDLPRATGRIGDRVAVAGQCDAGC